MSETNSDSLLERIDADLKQAMRDRDEVTKLTLRSVKTAVTEAAKAGEDHHLSQEQVVAIIQKEAKRRREAATEFEKAGDARRIAQELAELAVLEHYLPRQMGEAEIEQMARTVIGEVGATSAKEFGKVMAPLMARLQGQADGKLVSAVVRRLLNG